MAMRNEPASGVADSDIAVFGAKLNVHVAGQLMPVGDDVTVPLPVPVLMIVRVWFWKMSRAMV